MIRSIDAATAALILVAEGKAEMSDDGERIVITEDGKRSALRIRRRLTDEEWVLLGLYYRFWIFGKEG